MTQRERLPDDAADNRAVVYDTHETAAPQRTVATGAPTRYRDDRDVDIDVNTPTDGVRWGPIIAGLFTALSTLTLLSLLGAAVGLASYESGDRASDFGIGAGIWGALSALVAFGLGGWVAGRTSAFRTPRNGLLNGAMVWAVAIPLLLYLLSSGIGSLLGTAANTAASVAAPIAGQAAQEGADNPALQATAQAGAANLQATAQAAVTPERVENVADTAGRTAGAALVPLLLGLGAAALGGYLGGDQNRMRRRTVSV